ncbi:MAG TPA: gliding motility protein GldM [Mucilaginibacter sp.]|jgi:gliding motility-associated protein GldM|nr:gliding motility protein GldM [Mucilaginibacter sp.]
MAGGKQTPRQRMINILYLVLLGLIALNVPDNLLDAFRKIQISLNNSSDNAKKDIGETFTAFENSTLKDQPDRAKPIYDTAKMARDAAENLSNYVEKLRDELTKAGGGINPDLGDVDGRDNLDISPRMMIEEKRADSLKKLINYTSQRLMSLLRPKDRPGIELSLSTEDPQSTGGMPHKSWEDAYFGEGVPLGATLTNLAKIRADAKNAENEVVKKILSNAQKAQVNLDKFDAVAVAPTSYLLVGQPYTADVFLTAYDSKLNPSITVGGSALSVDAGKGKYSGDTHTIGLHTWQATVSFKNNDGKIQTYTTPPQTYMVAAPSAVVSPDKMNVLYIGIPNPISVSSPGIANKDLHVSISSGSINSRDPVKGEYEANVSTVGTATISISGTVGGKPAALGSKLFRIKKIPNPVAEFAGTSGGSQNTPTIQGQNYIFATLKDFEFDLKFNIKSYRLTIIRPRQDAVTVSGYGGTLSQEVKDKLRLVSPGTRLIFDEIYAVGPDKADRLLNDITIKAN